MKKLVLAALTLFSLHTAALAQSVAKVQTVIDAEEAFKKLVARKGIKDGFLAVADAEGIIFKPNAVNINEFYSNTDKQPGKLTWEPKIARIAANGDLAFTAGPYTYLNSKNEEDKVYGQYVSVWRTDAAGKLKLLIDLGIQHPEPEKEVIDDIKDPDAEKVSAPNKDPFKGKNIIMATDRQLNNALLKTTVGSYKEFFSPEGRFYFPGFEPMTGTDQVMRFVESQAIYITAETVNAGRAGSNDLAFSHGTARIKKGNIVSSFNYVRIWEIGKDYKWNMILEIFSAVEG